MLREAVRPKQLEVGRALLISVGKCGPYCVGILMLHNAEFLVHDASRNEI